MKKKSAIITWITYYNYGTYLQAYALQKYIMQLGWNNTILDDSKIISNHVNWKYEIKKYFMLIFQKKYRKCEKSRKLINLLFENFKHKYLIIDNRIGSLKSLDNKYDVYICGSDQIWNPFSLENLKTEFYYASFTQKKKIAYAPSIGVTKVPLQYKTKLKNLISSFDFLSSREPQGVDALHELTGKEVLKVVDPTMLLDVKQWNQLLPLEKCNNEKYILAYFLTPNKIFIHTALEYAKRKQLRLKIFFNDKSYYDYDCDLITAGPIEFLHYVRDAEYLFTDSFHGSIFASIFHTQFFTFKRFKQNPRSQNSRVENLLNMMNISERLLDEDNCNNMSKLSDIDFERVDYNLAPFIQKSKEYLNRSLQ